MNNSVNSPNSNTLITQLCNTLADWLTNPPPHGPHWPVETWEVVQRVCRVHGIAPFLYESTKATEFDPTIKSWLADQYHFNAQRIAKMHGELAEILGLFVARGVPIMPLKGAVLSAYYDNPACRPMADLDLLIQPNQANTAATLLAQLGYRQETVHWKHTEFSKPDNRQVVSTTVEHPDNPRTLELHLHCRETFGGPTIDLTSLMWQHAQSGTLLGQSTRVVNADALWLHLLVHCTYHLWQGRGRLIYLADLVQVAPRRRQPDVLLNAIDARYTYPALALLERHFPNTLDSEVLTHQRQRVSPQFRQWVAGLNLVNTSYLNPQPGGLYLTRALKFTDGRPHEVAQALRFALLPSTNELALDHPYLAQSAVPWLAYFLLPLDWAKRLLVSRKT